MQAEETSWSRTTLIALAVAVTLVGEIIAVVIRVFFGTAVEFNATDPPLLLQVHHMFWSIPFFIAAAVISSPRVRSAAAGIGLGLVLSDLVHHFVVLPLWVGNTGWHWP